VELKLCRRVEWGAYGRQAAVFVLGLVFGFLGSKGSVKGDLSLVPGGALVFP